MLYLFIIACIVISILVAAMFIILKSTVKKINSQTKLYFVDKLQEYDYLINEKEEKLEQINKELREKEIKTEETTTSFNKTSYEFDYNIIGLLNQTKYQDKNIFELNKKIDEKFDIDHVSLLKKFATETNKNNQYTFCKNLKDKFTSKEIFYLKTLTNIEYEKKLNEMLSSDEYKIYEIFKQTNKDLSVESFIDYINELLDLNNPTIIVYVGNKDENYDHIDKNIKTIYSKDIYKGIKVLYQNKIYDYSLNERNV